jgi:hypothetical protein
MRRYRVPRPGQVAMMPISSIGNMRNASDPPHSQRTPDRHVSDGAHHGLPCCPQGRCSRWSACVCLCDELVDGEMRCSGLRATFGRGGTPAANRRGILERGGHAFASNDTTTAELECFRGELAVCRYEHDLGMLATERIGLPSERSHSLHMTNTPRDVVLAKRRPCFAS